MSSRLASNLRLYYIHKPASVYEYTFLLFNFMYFTYRKFGKKSLSNKIKLHNHFFLRDFKILPLGKII